MKEIFKFLPLLPIFLSCSDDTPNESHEFLESIQGTYFGSRTKPGEEMSK